MLHNRRLFCHLSFSLHLDCRRQYFFIIFTSYIKKFSSTYIMNNNFTKKNEEVLLLLMLTLFIIYIYLILIMKKTHKLLILFFNHFKDWWKHLYIFSKIINGERCIMLTTVFFSVYISLFFIRKMKFDKFLIWKWSIDDVNGWSEKKICWKKEEKKECTCIHFFFVD
jgi:hypothetical protein